MLIEVETNCRRFRHSAVVSKASVKNSSGIKETAIDFIGYNEEVALTGITMFCINVC